MFYGQHTDVKPALPSVSFLFTVDPLEPVSTLVKYALTTLHGVVGRQRALVALSSSVSEEAAGSSGGGEPGGPPRACHSLQKMVHPWRAIPGTFKQCSFSNRSGK